MASKALRVLGIAFKELPEKINYSTKTIEKDFVSDRGLY